MNVQSLEHMFGIRYCVACGWSESYSTPATANRGGCPSCGRGMEDRQFRSVAIDEPDDCTIIGEFFGSDGIRMRTKQKETPNE